MDRLHELHHGILHFLRARRRHGIHSPFVYELMDRVLSRPGDISAFAGIERLRSALLQENRALKVTDFGAGSRKNKVPERKIKDIVRYAASEPKQALAIALYCRYTGAETIVELGTNVGIGTAYLAAVNKKAEIFTLEGDPGLAEMAGTHFQQLGMHRISVITGAFEDHLETLLKRCGPVDILFMDGNHRKEPTLLYLKTVLPYLSEDASVIVDDIYWSKEMTEAWREMTREKAFNLTLDFFHFGILKKTKRKEREYFRLRL